jgi:hypothetical protein
MEQGGHVVYLDFEQGEGDTAERLIALGADADLLDERLHYLAWPDLSDWAQLEELWDEWPGALGLWDSMAGVLETLGLDEDKPSQVKKFSRPLLQLSKQHGPQLVLDHLVKTEDGKGIYAQRGAAAKLGDVEALWYVEKQREFSQSEVGEVHLIRKRQRRGGLRQRVYLKVGDGQGGLPVEETDADDAATTAGRIRRDVKTFLADNPGARFTKTDVRKEVRGENQRADRRRPSDPGGRPGRARAYRDRRPPGRALLVRAGPHERGGLSGT